MKNPTDWPLRRDRLRSRSYGESAYRALSREAPPHSDFRTFRWVGAGIGAIAAGIMIVALFVAVSALVGLLGRAERINLECIAQGRVIYRGHCLEPEIASTLARSRLN